MFSHPPEWGAEEREDRLVGLKDIGLNGDGAGGDEALQSCGAEGSQE